MSPSSPPAPRGLSRRAFLAASAGLALAAAGCTGGSDDPAVDAERADRLAAQVPVQEAVVAAYAAATAADAVLAGELGTLARQATEQLDRLRAAAPSATSSAAASSSRAPASASAAAPAPPPGADVRGWLRDQVAAAAGSHADASVDQSGAAAALLGSIAAGLLGHEAALA
ncbi:hypothetical protein ACI782_14735 [Geodermatophilus sp. SYSU D00703]